MKVMSVFGTRPEAIKMCPLVLEMEKHPEIESVVCLTGQHREMLDQVMHIFGIKAQYDLNIMRPKQTLTTITTSVLEKMEDVLMKPHGLAEAKPGTGIYILTDDEEILDEARSWITEIEERDGKYVITKKDYFAMVAEIVDNSNAENKDELMEFIEKQVEALDKKAAKAKERAAEKKAEGDALRDKVEAVLTNEVQVIDQIVEAIGDEDVTRNKVVARLTQLVKADIAVKEEVKNGSKKVMGYKLKTEDAADDAEDADE